MAVDAVVAVAVRSAASVDVVMYAPTPAAAPLPPPPPSHSTLPSPALAKAPYRLASNAAAPMAAVDGRTVRRTFALLAFTTHGHKNTHTLRQSAL